jgi:hypothetical protein
MDFNVEFSNEHNLDFGTYFQSKLVRKETDELLGIESKQTYYLWGTKQLSGTIDLNIDKYRVVEKEVEIDGKSMTLKQIVGLK